MGAKQEYHQDPEVIENVIKIYRCAAVAKGGRRFSFSALVVVGDGRGRVGIGYGKANEVPSAVEKAMKDARRNQVKVTILNETIPHEIVGRYGSARIILAPAGPGTGIIAGGAVRAVLQAAGVGNILTKSHRTANPKNLARATLDGLVKCRSLAQVEKLRGRNLTATGQTS
ncbi:MAG: 30S ribosomal protein S5 [Planctomycetota bacterium]|nr:30S ribosomal protein S5 [Planctomycetota bacterium]MDA1141328.1 30S ribosomal protein S5 [Planctomycetota bacterium]